MQVKRIYFSRFTSGFIDVKPDDNKDVINNKIIFEPDKVHKDLIKIHKTHLINNHL